MGIHLSPVDSPNEGPVMRSLDIFFNLPEQAVEQTFQMSAYLRRHDDHRTYAHDFAVLCFIVVIMTSSNGSIFRVNGPLCGEFTGPGEFPTQRPVTRSFDVFWSASE